MQNPKRLCGVQSSSSLPHLQNKDEERDEACLQVELSSGAPRGLDRLYYGLSNAASGHASSSKNPKVTGQAEAQTVDINATFTLK